MERPSASLVGSILIHFGVIGAIAVSTMLGVGARPPSEIVNAVPVQIVSETVVMGASADNPSEELIIEETATAPVETVAEPVPPPPEPVPPRPTPRPPEKAVTPRPTPQPTPRPPRPATPPPVARPVAPRPQPGLNLDELAGPPRPGPRRNQPPPTGGAGPGTASRSTGPAQWNAIFNQVYRNWSPPCSTPGVSDMRIQMDVTLTRDGRIARPPVLVGRQSGSVWEAVAAGAERALYQSAPFDVPEGFEGGTARTTFVTARLCGGD